VSAAVVDDELAQFLEVVFRTYHHDFRLYAIASLKRRLSVALIHFGASSLGELAARIERDSAAFTQLLRFLTVQVSDLFRDPSYFRAIRETVVPHLSTFPSLKVWVPGCATGEEAYSLAILLHEEGVLDRTLIYATDISPDALRTAADGIYHITRFTRFTSNYLIAGGKASLSEYYTARYSSVMFDGRLRKSILFSEHSLATDGAFAEVQLVSCRNVLIYFDRQLQNRAVGVLRDSLCDGGFLGLGNRESLAVTGHSAEFRDLVPEERIYERVQAPSD